jgi:uncharacterized protein YndB with AHSA1/START domain
MTPEPIVKTLRVALSPDTAFELFTKRMDTWWPLESHSVSAGGGAPSKSLTFEARMGGELIEVTSEGVRHVWGKVHEWEPGVAFAMSWHPGKPAAEGTRVRVTFAADGDGCQVVVTHDGWEVLGENGAKMRDGYNGGWVGVLERYTQAA